MVKLIHKLHNCEVNETDLTATMKFDSKDELQRFMYVWETKIETLEEFLKKGGRKNFEYRYYLLNKILKAIKKVGAEEVLFDIVSMIDTDKLEVPVSYINDVYLKDDD